MVIVMVQQHTYEHETGLNQVKEGQTTAITASIESGDFDIGQQGLLVMVSL